MRLRTLPFFLVVLASTLSVSAQKVTSRIIGPRRDPTRAVLRPASVALDSPPRRLGVVTIVANERAGRRFVMLQSGLRQMKVRLVGFRTSEESGWRVAAAGAGGTEVVLPAVAVAESITVKRGAQ